MPNAIVNTGDTEINKTKTLFSESLHSNQENRPKKSNK